MCKVVFLLVYTYASVRDSGLGLVKRLVRFILVQGFAGLWDLGLRAQLGLGFCRIQGCRVPGLLVIGL